MLRLVINRELIICDIGLQELYLKHSRTTYFKIEQKFKLGIHYYHGKYEHVYCINPFMKVQV